MANEDNKKHSDQFDAALPLPGSDNGTDSGPAADLIRKKVEAAYETEPDFDDEVSEVEDIKTKERWSKHQEYIYELTNSGRPLHEIQTAWHEYYAGLPDAQKHEVWQEFYSAHKDSAKHPAIAHSKPRSRPHKAVKNVRSRVSKSSLKKTPLDNKAPEKRPSKPKKAASPMHSLLFGLGIGSITLLIFLFSFFNERIISPFIQPSRNVNNIPFISTAAVGPDAEVVIPKINVEIPVIYDVNTINEQAIEKGLERGVVHYADTAVPGQNGNAVIVGHSSNNILNHGKYKFAFVLLHKLNVGDTFYLQKDGKRYTYQVYKRDIVKPSDVSVLGLAEKTASATLITCDPPGTSNNRLVIVGEQISPDPIANAPSGTANTYAKSVAIVPGNSPTLWSRIVGWFTQ
jgi:LPXTG-site transpeptidase (sortase) family protein